MTASRFLSGFTLHRVQANGITQNVAMAGTGPAVLLLHGHPQTHIVWRKVAPALVTAGYRVIAPDLRGYGDSDAPPSAPDHAPYSKREMARDQIALLQAVGEDTATVIGHDRGGRVAHRMALDHPQAINRLCVVDIAPTATMYARTDSEFARRYFWWFFLIQPAPLPERMIGADPEFFLRRHISGQVQTEGAVTEDIIAEYLRCYAQPARIHAICEDYRAAATSDLEHDAADADRKIDAPLLAIWGAQGTVGQLYDVTATWQEKATHIQGIALPCGHAVQEEQPDTFLKHVLDFLQTS